MAEEELPVIDHAACIHCGVCIDICPDGIMQAGKNNVATVVGDVCMGCGHCYSVCPADAISVPWLERRLGLSTISEDIGRKPKGIVAPDILIDMMKARRSCRLFKTEPVDLAVLNDLVQIGTTAPSGTNSQGWQFVLLPERADVVQLAEATAEFYQTLNTRAANPFYRFITRIFAGNALGQYYDNYYNSVEQALIEWRDNGIDRLFHGAPSAIIVTADTSSSCPKEDALLATQNILLAAESMGISTCLIGFVVEAAKRDRRIMSLLRLGQGEKIYSVIACGYPAVVFKRPAGRRKVNPRIIRLSKDQRTV